MQRLVPAELARMEVMQGVAEWILPRRAILDRSPSYPASSVRRLVIEATFAP